MLGEQYLVSQVTLDLQIFSTKPTLPRQRSEAFWGSVLLCQVTLGKSDPPWDTPAGCAIEVKAMFPMPKMLHSIAP